ncbi:MAG: hypothetical protein U9N52_00015 [Campylobacterota bacterium]|nr:hypothetical protein [Campylobacterota bacterium]
MKFLLIVFFPLLLLASVEGIWKLDLPTTKEHNPNTKTYRAFESVTLEFKEGKIFQNGSQISLYRLNNGEIFESQDGATWEPSALHVKNDTLTLDIGSALLYFKAFIPEIERLYDLNISGINFSEDDFYEGDSYKYRDDDKIPWIHAQLYNTFESKKEIGYRVYQNLNNTMTQTDTHIFHFKDNSATAFSYRKFGQRQDDWIDMDWHRIDHDEPYWQKKEKAITFSPLFGDMELFHFKGKEEVITPAGTFTCSKIEGIQKPWDDPVVVWMIDDQAGIYAKVVNLKEKKLYLLETIKEK